MDRSNIITLISTTYTMDSIGQNVPTESTKDVFCKVESVNSQEFFSAGQSGIKAEYRFTMFEPDYSGEKIIKFNNKRYGVYRTYHAKNDMIELYVEEKAGV